MARTDCGEMGTWAQTEASCCPVLHERTAQGNPGKQRAAANEDLVGSFCPTSAAGPLRLNKAPEMERNKQVVKNLLDLLYPLPVTGLHNKDDAMGFSIVLPPGFSLLCRSSNIQQADKVPPTTSGRSCVLRS